MRIVLNHVNLASTLNLVMYLRDEWVFYQVLPHDNFLKKKGFLEPAFCKHPDDVSFSDEMQERTPVPPELAAGTASDTSSLDVIVTEVVKHR